MAGPVLGGRHNVSWASRTDSAHSSRSSMSPTTGRGGLQSETIPEVPGSSTPSFRGQDRSFFPATEERFVETSPLPAATPDVHKADVSPQEGAKTPGLTGRAFQSAPAAVGPQLQNLSIQSQAVRHNTCRDAPPLVFTKPSSRSQGFELDPNAPIRAVRTGGNGASDSPSAVKSKEPVGGKGGRNRQGNEKSKQEEEGAQGDTWGQSFRIEWICTDRLSFQRTRHLRNPWNHDREVKVSRDGTELEPGVGQMLLEEWSRLSGPPPPQQQQPAQGSGKASGAKPTLGSPASYSGGTKSARGSISRS
jgi:hypothetical protein